MPASRSEPVVNFGGTSVRKRVLARAWSPGSCPAGVAGGVLFNPLNTVSRFRNGDNGWRIDGSSKSAPAAAGVQCCSIRGTPFGT